MRDVSIHAPWEGCDDILTAIQTMLSCFNSRTLGRVRPDAGLAKKLGISVSIHAPWEGCDGWWHRRGRSLHCFNSRTLGRVRQGGKGDECAVLGVSIHAPWEGCDISASKTSRRKQVSIHAPWEGCDCISAVSPARHSGFNSRTLGRVRRSILSSGNIVSMFQFTHPGKGATSSAG